MIAEQSIVRDSDGWFDEKIGLISDPYFEREFFTNLIFCLDRKKTCREVFEAVVMELSRRGESTDESDRALLHLFYAYQASNFLRESYQWLPLAQGIFSLAIFRGDGKKPLKEVESKVIEARGSTIEEFVELIRPEARRVTSYERAWSSFIFLMGNRSSRTKALEALVEAAVFEDDILTSSLIMKSIDLSFASAWRRTDVLMKRAFERFWQAGLDLGSSEFFNKAWSLTEAKALNAPELGGSALSTEATEELWRRLSEEGAESAWEWMLDRADQGHSLEQLFQTLDLARGRVLAGMKWEAWSWATQSLQYAASLRAAARWRGSRKSFYLAMSLVELARLCQRLSLGRVSSFSNSRVLDGSSVNISKNQLVLRLDDAMERGDSVHAFELLGVILQDKGLSHSVADRLVLEASKQDSWTYDQTTIPTALLLTEAYESAVRLKLSDKLASDCLHGLLRFLCDQRVTALDQIRKQGRYNYGGLYKSPFDVSGGARIADRFVFNQMRNAQRIFVWPSEAKG